MSILFSICIGLGLSASSGFRVFLPLFMVGIASRFYLLPLNLTENMLWIGSFPALICLGTATIAEIGGYYIPVVDNFLDTIATPAALIAGTLLSASVLHTDPFLQWTLAIIIGGGSAGLTQTGTSLLRLSSTVGTGGFANPIIATFEHILAFIGTLLSLWIPIIAAILFSIFLFMIGKRVYKGWIAKNP
jgi:hypothetical protein